MKTASQLHG